MKKLLSIICCLVIFAASSCTKQYVAPAVTTTNKSFNSGAIAPGNWVLTTDKASYATDVNIPDITSNFTSYGGIIVSLTFDNGASYEQLPEVYNGVSYTYTYTTGKVTLYSQSADGTTAVLPTSTLIARVILVDAN